jgi:hypothetical protein
MRRLKVAVRDGGIELTVTSRLGMGPWSLALTLIFLLIWLTLAVYAWVQAVADLATGRATSLLSLMLWLLGWTVGIGFVAFWGSWLRVGHELVTVSKDSLQIKREMFGLGPARRFALRDVSNVRAAGFFGSPWRWAGSLWYWGLSGGTVAFDVGGRTYRFGIHLEEHEVRQVVEKLSPYLRPRPA